MGEVAKGEVVSTPTVNDVANAVKLGTVDAGIVWDAVMAQYPTLDMVAVPEAQQEKVSGVGHGPEVHRTADGRPRLRPLPSGQGQGVARI